MNEQTKICGKCKNEKSVTDFHVRRDRPCGRQGWCKTCAHTHASAYNKKKKFNPEGARALASYYRKYLWGITLDEYEWLLAQQKGKCALCGIIPTGKRLAVDHWHGHHENRKKGCRECIRGLLCDRCNRHFLYIAEQHPDLQSHKVRLYLRSRPFLQSLTNRSDGVIKTPPVVLEDFHTGIPGASELAQTELPVQSPG